MGLPLTPPIAPQLARSADALPIGDGWVYEPKWDGFRVIAFVDGDDCYLQSRGERPLGRYFPELTLPPGRYVLDGEIVILSADGHADFEALQTRLHPAASRVAMLAEQTPARLVAFDLLAVDDTPLLEQPFAQRRERLATIIEPTASSTDPDQARAWLESIEGVIAKELAAPYLPGKRAGMVKVKRVRTLDLVVRGYRAGKAPGTIGSLILALYDASGTLVPVGHASGFAAAAKRSLRDRVVPLETGQRGQGEPSRWSKGRDAEWVELEPSLVVEVAFDHASGGRIRHGARILRFREDKPPRACVMPATGSPFD